MVVLFFFKQKTAYEIRSSDWSSCVCSSDLVVVGRADAAGGEDIIVARPQRVQRVDDLVLDVGNDAHFAQANTLHVEPGRDLRDIPVLGAAGENLVADHQHGGSPDAFVAHPFALPRWHDKTSPLER